MFKKASVFIVTLMCLMVVSSSAFAEFKRVYHRADFDSKVSQSTKQDFVDDFFADCASNGLDGLIIGREGGADFILEGDATDVDNAIATLEFSSVLENNETLYTATNGPIFSHLSSHMDTDARSQTSPSNTGTNLKWLEAELDSNLTQADRLQFIDQIFTTAAQNDVEGVIIGLEGGSEYILEGDSADVATVVDAISSHSAVTNTNEIYEETGAGGEYDKLTSHDITDARDVN